MKTKSLIAVAVGITVSLTLFSCGGKDKSGGKDGGAEALETVTIGSKTWMKKNLNIETENSWCYDDDPANCEKYCRLYTWDAAVKACSALGGGWRLPTNEDWDALVNAAGGKEVAGGKLKSKVGWNENGNGTDEFGFSALPAGNRGFDENFYGIGYHSNWWGAEDGDATSANYRLMDYRNEYVHSRWSNKYYAFSVRCVKDDGADETIETVEYPETKNSDVPKDIAQFIPSGYGLYQDVEL